MLCPHCHITLKKIKSPLGLLFVCPSCDGRAANFHIFKKNCEYSVFVQMTKTLHASDVVGKVGCPSCTLKMQQVSINLSDQILQIDVCKTCMFIWFDKNEFEISEAENLQLIYKENIPKQAKWETAKRRGISDPFYHENGSIAEEDNWRRVFVYLGMPAPKDKLKNYEFSWATFILSMITILFSLYFLSNVHQYALKYGIIPNDFLHNGIIRWFTAFFVHGDIFHLLGNMYFLIVFGMLVEDDIGIKKYLILIAGATFFGSILHVLGELHSSVPCIGASGGISGVLVYYGLRFRNSKIYYAWNFSLYYSKVFEVDAIYLLVLWLLLQLIGIYKQLAGISCVSALGHIGGALFGALIWYIYSKQENNFNKTVKKL